MFTQQGTKKKIFIVTLVVAITVFAVGLVSCVPAAPEAKLPQALITYDLAEEVELTKIGFCMEDGGNGSVLHIEVGLRNASDEPERFVVRLLVQDGPVVGSYVPRKGTAPVGLDPGKEWSGKFPTWFDRLPEGLLVEISTTDFYEL